MAPLRYAAKFDPFLSLDCAPTPSTLAQSNQSNRNPINPIKFCHLATLPENGVVGTDCGLEHGGGALRHHVASEQASREEKPDKVQELGFCK